MEYRKRCNDYDGTGTIDINNDIVNSPTNTRAIMDLEGANVFLADDFSDVNQTLVIVPGTSTFTFDGASGISTLTDISGTFNHFVIDDSDGGSNLVFNWQAI